MSTDSELLSAVRESFAGVRLDAPLDATVRRGRKLRARRRAAGLAGAGVVIAGGAALATALLVPGGAAQPAGTSPRPAPSGPVRYRTAAWTVASGPDQTVTVLIRQLSDPAGLQRALRADGVPAAVAFEGGVLPDTPPLPRACRNTGLSTEKNIQLQSEIVSSPAVMTYGSLVALVIHPEEIPKGIGLNLTVQLSASGNSWGWSLGLVRASPECTGS